MSQRQTRAEPFTIKDCALIQIAAGERAQNLRELRDRLEEMSRKARQFVRENFLITRYLLKFLTLMLGLARGAGDRFDMD